MIKRALGLQNENQGWPVRANAINKIHTTKRTHKATHIPNKIVKSLKFDINKLKQHKDGYLGANVKVRIPTLKLDSTTASPAEAMQTSRSLLILKPGASTNLFIREACDSPTGIIQVAGLSARGSWMIVEDPCHAKKKSRGMDFRSFLTLLVL